MFKASFDVKMVSISAILKPENFTEQNKKNGFFCSDIPYFFLSHYYQ